MSRDTLNLGQVSIRKSPDVVIEVLRGPNRGRRIGPVSAPVRVGAADSNDLVLSDRAVSSFHLSVEMRPLGVAVVDQASSNGTWLANHQLREAYVGEGIIVQAGTSQLRIGPAERPRLLPVSESEAFGDLIGESAEMRSLFATLEQAAQSDGAVLLEGEPGTGKELAARGLHALGPDRSAPFVVVDCGAASPSMLEDELFGHERDASGGSKEVSPGALEGADGGTFFLDEVGELPLGLQSKVLRSLETGHVKRIGAEDHRTVQFRMISATHRDLRQMVNEGTFREDLYHRLAVLTVRIPPLRERPEDIRLLTRRFLARALELDERSVEVPEPHIETLGYLCRSRWPGNVRELRNLVDRAVAVSDTQDLERGDLLPAFRQLQENERVGEFEVAGLEAARKAFEIAYIDELLRRHRGDITSAAREAQIHPKSLQRLLRRHRMQRPKS